MNETVRGLILKQIDYRESDVILSVLTRDYGKLSFLAPGVRKLTSKNAGAVIPCTLARIDTDLKPARSMQRLKTARSEKMYPFIHSDLPASACASFMAECADALSLAENELGTAAEEYDLLEKAWDALEERKPGDIVCALYLADLCRILGIEPEVDGCVRCGSQSVSAISPADGGFLCASCAAASGIAPSDAKDLRRFRLIVKAGMEHLEYVCEEIQSASSSLSALCKIIRIHAGVQIRSFELVRRLFAIE